MCCVCSWDTSNMWHQDIVSLIGGDVTASLRKDLTLLLSCQSKQCWAMMGVCELIYLFFQTQTVCCFVLYCVAALVRTRTITWQMFWSCEHERVTGLLRVTISHIRDTKTKQWVEQHTLLSCTIRKTHQVWSACWNPSVSDCSSWWEGWNLIHMNVCLFIRHWVRRICSVVCPEGSPRLSSWNPEKLPVCASKKWLTRQYVNKREESLHIHTLNPAKKNC